MANQTRHVRLIGRISSTSAKVPTSASYMPVISSTATEREPLLGGGRQTRRSSIAAHYKTLRTDFKFREPSLKEERKKRILKWPDLTRRDPWHRHSSKRDLLRRQKTDDTPILTCLILAMPWAALSIINTLFDDVRVTYMTSLGMSDTAPRFLPALTQFVLAPIFGAASDRSLSSWGRRSTFMLVAAGMAVVGGVLFASAKHFFPHNEAAINALCVLLSASLLLMDIVIRARIMDQVKVAFQVHAQAAVTMWKGVGGVLGMLLFQNFTSDVIFASEVSSEHILTSFGYGLIGVIFTTVLCVWLRPERQQDRPISTPSLAPLLQETVDHVVYAPMIFRVLCLVDFVLYFTWSTFRGQTFHWWGGHVYGGCREEDDCAASGVALYKEGLKTANITLMAQYASEVAVCFLLIALLPKEPDAWFIKRASVFGLAVGAIALVASVIIDSRSIPVAASLFIITGIYHVVVSVFPYSVVGILGRKMQVTPRGFNNNGLYVGMLMLFGAASELTVQLYGTEDMAPLGTDNVMALPCVLFVIGLVCTSCFQLPEYDFN